MAETTPYRVMEINRLPGRSLDHSAPEGLLVAHLGTSDSVGYCSGVLLGHASKAHPVQALDARLSAEQFGRILETGQFCIEIPSENFLSEVITEKLRRVPPQDRVSLLAELMQQKDIPRCSWYTRWPMAQRLPISGGCRCRWSQIRRCALLPSSLRPFPAIECA